MTALPLELWLIILECLGLADLRIARQVCYTWHQWAFKIRWRSHPVLLRDIISLQEPLEPIPKQGLKRFYRSTILGSSRDSVDILFNIAAKIRNIVIDSAADVDAIPHLKGLVASSPPKALFPALRSLEYAVEAAYSDINEIITGSRLKKIIITSTPYDDIDGVSQIFPAFQHHQDLEDIDLAGSRQFDFSDIHPVPWPPRLRRVHFNGVWTFRSWEELLERCVELHHAKIGFYSREPPAPEDPLTTITARNLAVLDLDDVRHSHLVLLILRRTEMPELGELSFKLGEDALQEGTDDEVEEALRVLGEKSPKLGSLRVETYVPLETELLSKFRGLETLYISNQAGEAWPWVYWDEDIENIARSMPRLAHLRLPGLTHRGPGTTMAALDSLAVHCKRLHTLAIGINTTESHFPKDVAFPFGKTLTSITFLPLRISTSESAVALVARNLSARMPGVNRFQGRVLGLDAGGRAFYWDGGLKIIGNRVERFRKRGVAGIIYWDDDLKIIEDTVERFHEIGTIPRPSLSDDGTPAFAFHQKPNLSDHFQSSLPILATPLYGLMESYSPYSSSPSYSPNTSSTSHNTAYSLQSLNLPTNEDSTSSQLASTPDLASNEDQQEHVIAEQFATNNYVANPATEKVVDLLQALGRAAPQTVRNKHKIYSVLRAAHNTCNYIIQTGNPPGIQENTGIKHTLDRMEQYCVALDALEEILLEFAEILHSEITVFGPELYSSWLQSRSTLAEILSKLCHPPFPEISYNAQDIAEDSFFDDCSWLSHLLCNAIDAEVDVLSVDPPMAHLMPTVTNGLHYLESQIKFGVQNESTRELVLDIATLLAQTLAATSTGRDSELDQREPSHPTAASRDWLFQALAASFSILNLGTALEASATQELASKWTEIKTGLPSRGMSALEN